MPEDVPAGFEAFLSLVGLFAILSPWLAKAIEPYSPRVANRLLVLGADMRGLLPSRYVPRVLPPSLQDGGEEDKK